MSNPKPPNSTERDAFSGRTSRRGFLTTSLLASLAALWPGSLSAFGGPTIFEWPSLRYAGPWERRQGAQGRLAWELMKRTSIEAKLEHGAVDAGDPALFDTPVLYWSGDAAFDPLPEEVIANLRRFCLFGGFIFVDGNLEAGDGFDKSLRREMARLFPDLAFETLPPEHTLFKSFYLLDGRWGRVQRRSFVEGITRDNRTMLVYSQNDVGGAWMRDNFGNWRFPVIPGGERQREMAFRFGVNLIMYALCTNYKNDQVHIPFILKRRRR